MMFLLRVDPNTQKFVFFQTHIKNILLNFLFIKKQVLKNESLITFKIKRKIFFGIFFNFNQKTQNYQYEEDVIVHSTSFLLMIVVVVVVVELHLDYYHHLFY